ncbi:KilA-N domain-containing protein [bacterium]|nr:KilA-N domain-containing protein [bacterium]
MRVKGTAVTVLTQREDDYISLTDIARHKNSERIDDLIRNWLRNRNTIEFLGVWERLNNPVFKPVEFDGIRIQAGLNSFTLTPKQWIEKTAAIGIVSRPGRYGGTFAHMKLSQGERLKRLNEIAIRQMQVLTSVPAVKKLKG